MAVYKFESDIGEDRNVVVPADVPLGRAEIVITPHKRKEFDRDKFLRVLEKTVNGPHHLRSRQEIDDELRRERESWE